MVGVRGVSDACSRHDAFDGHEQGLRERVVDGVFGSVQVVSTALGVSGGISTIVVRVKFPLGAGTLTRKELADLQKIADDFDTEIHVVGSRASGKGRNIDSKFPVGKEPKSATRSDIDCRVDGSNQRVENVIDRINATETANAKPKHDFRTRETHAPAIK